MHVLLVENGSTGASALQLLLAAAGHAVTCANSPTTALTILDQGAFPVVVIHGEGQAWDVEEFCHGIKARQTGQHIWTLIVGPSDLEVDGALVDDLLADPTNAWGLEASLQLAERWLLRQGGGTLPFPEVRQMCA